MDVYVGNLPESATNDELNALFAPYAKEVDICIHHKLNQDGSELRFARGTVLPDKGALKAFKKLKTPKLHGKPLVIREYFHRASYNERRDLNWRDKPWNGTERRQGERRQIGRVVEEGRIEKKQEESVSFQSYDNMAVKHL